MSMEIDKSAFSNEPFIQKIDKPWGHEIIFTPKQLPYTGKILHVNAGQRLSLQIHDKKQETQYLMSGNCLLIADDQDGTLVEINMEKGKGYTISIGQRHRLRAIEDSDIFEVSTPEIGTTIRLEDDWQRPDETHEMRDGPNRGWME